MFPLSRLSVLTKPGKKLFPLLFAHILFLKQALHIVLCKTAGKDLVNILQKSIGGEKHHIISRSALNNPSDIGSNVIVFRIRSSCIPAGHVGCDEQSSFCRVKHGSRIYLVILFPTPEQPLIILDREQGCRKEDGAPSPGHALPKVSCRIDAEEPYGKPSIRFHLCINHIVFIQIVAHQKEMRDLEIEIQDLILYRAVLILLQIIRHNAGKPVQCSHKGRNGAFALVRVILAFPFQLQKLPVAALQFFAQINTVILYRLFECEKILLHQNGAVHIPSPIHKIMRLVNQENVFLADSLREKTL